MVATTVGADVDLICDVTNTASQVAEITITYDGTAYTTYVTVYTVWIMSEFYEVLFNSVRIVVPIIAKVVILHVQT